MQNLDDFMESLLQEKGINVEGEVRDQLKEDMIQTLMTQIDRATLNRLTEEQATELSEKLDDPNFGNEQAAEYIRSCGIDAQEVALETMVMFRALYLGGGTGDVAGEAAETAEPAETETVATEE
ncbi:MAG: hypothetical protein MJ154_01510 [Candidatus Saccharibacteria bacterium]|nr:hypothetical protein [Candidatus Saccharibacteria bacterium]